MTEEDEWWRQPWPVQIRHYVAITVVFPQLIGYGCHVKIDVAVKNYAKTLSTIKAGFISR